MHQLDELTQKYLLNKKGFIEQQRLNASFFMKNGLGEEWNFYCDILTNLPKYHDFLRDNAMLKTNAKLNHYNTCLCCGATTDFISVNRGYKRFCSKTCGGRYTFNGEKLKQTMLLKYGVDNAYKLPQTQRGIRSPESEIKRMKSFERTCMKRYGVKNPACLNSSKEKMKQTNLKKYGTECSLNNANIRAKARNTLRLHYGVEHNFSIPYIREIRNECSKNSFFAKLYDSFNSYSSYRQFRNKCYKVYHKLVWHFTRKQNISNLDNFEIRRDGLYELDHMFSIYDGFLNNIPAHITGSIVNLKFIPRVENRKKGRHSSITKEQLLDMYFNNR